MQANMSNIKLSDDASALIGLKSDFLYTFTSTAIPLIAPFFMHLIEDYGGYYKWYKLTDYEKEQMLRKYGGSNYFKFCQFVENNIGYIKDAIFVIKIGTYVVSEFIMINFCEDRSCIDSWQNFLNPFSKHIMWAYLATFILYDIIGIAVKRYYKKKCLPQNASLESSSDSGLSDILIHSQSSIASTIGIPMSPINPVRKRSVSTQTTLPNFYDKDTIEITSRERINNFEIGAYRHIDQSGMSLRRRSLSATNLRRTF